MNILYIVMTTIINNDNIRDLIKTYLNNPEDLPEDLNKPLNNLDVS